MSWDYKLANKAVKNLKRLPKSDQKRIFETLEERKVDPFRGDRKPIQGEENLWRRRVGAYRIYFRPMRVQHTFEVPEIVRKQSR